MKRGRGAGVRGLLPHSYSATTFTEIKLLTNNDKVGTIGANREVADGGRLEEKELRGCEYHG